jgi:hypothetical protein
MEVAGKFLQVSRRLPRILRLRDEYYDFIDDPEPFIALLKNRPDVAGDIFSFTQQIPDAVPKYTYRLEWDSAAVLPLSTYENWWKRQINDKTRNMVRKAGKAGVQIREVPFDQALVSAIHKIYDESPVRQNRPFKHYGKTVDTIREEHATFLDRSQFFAAFHNDSIIGFVKLVHGRGVSSLMNIISMIAHRDKAPTNALIAKAVEVCTSNGIPQLQYGTGNSRTIGDFKKHHAFAELRVPRYFVPITTRGRLLLSLGFHRELRDRIPEQWRDSLTSWRGKWISMRSRNGRGGAVA